ncbi:MAG: hydrogenase maturation protease [Acidobacteria bacterium]|nr:hydrogenase maturation protease [Acidobacteriota bacterium]
MKTLVLALGNDILGDDGAGPAAARLLRPTLPAEVDVIESSEAGLALLEYIEGYDRVLLLDAVVTGRCAPGTVIELSPDELEKIVSPSPHYAGIPEVLEMGRRLGLKMPGEIRILALEVERPETVCEGFTPSVKAGLPAFASRAAQVVNLWTRPHTQSFDAAVLTGTARAETQ